MSDDPAPAEATIWERYHEAFPNDPVPLQAWHDGAPEILAALMDKAIRVGVALTPNDLLMVKGLELEPPAADT